MTRSITLALLASTLAMSGCYSVRYTSGALQAAGAEKSHVYKTWSHSIFWGLVPTDKVDLDAVCGEAEVLGTRSFMGPFGFFATAISLGFWTPQRVRVTCADPASYIVQGPPTPPVRTSLALPQRPAPPPPQDEVVVLPDGRTIVIVH